MDLSKYLKRAKGSAVNASKAIIMHRYKIYSL